MYLIVYKEDATSAFLAKDVYTNLDQATTIALDDIKRHQGSAHIYEIIENQIHEIKVFRYMPYWGDKEPIECVVDDDDEETVIELAY